MFIPLQNLPIQRLRRSQPFKGLRNAAVAGILPSEYEGNDAAESEATESETVEGEDEYGGEDYSNESD